MAVSPKQLFVCLSTLLAGFSAGGALTFPTVLLHQLTANDSTIQLDFETSSWIGSIHGLAGLPSILMPAFMQWQGRKLAFIVAGLFSITGWIVTCTANSTTLILISECLQGLGDNNIYIVICLTITEMIGPKYREVMLQMYYLANLVGMISSGLLVQYVHWKTISFIMCIPMALAVLVACAWPESPYWLAYKRKFERCEEAFIGLRGSDPDSIKEMNELINSNKEEYKRKVNTTRSNEYCFKSFWRQITSRDFYVPCFHMVVLEFTLYGTGGMVMIIYSIEIFMKSNISKAVMPFASFIVNVFLFVGFITHMSIKTYFKIKTLFLSSIICCTVSLLSAAVVTYLQEGSSSDSIVSLICLIACMFSISSGILPLAHPVSSSLMPVRHRGVGGLVYAICICLFHTLTLKSAPYMFLYLHMWGTFIVYAGAGVICGLIIWRFVPETKNRTLQEIDNYYTYGKFESNRTTDENLEAMIVT